MALGATSKLDSRSCFCWRGLSSAKSGLRTGHGAAPIDGAGARGAPAEEAPLKFYSPRVEAAAEVVPPLLSNGFVAIPEPETIRIEDDRNLAAFSLPEEALSFTPTDDVVQFQYPGGDCERMIHNNTPLRDGELDQLCSLREEARSRGYTFYPSIAVAATRFIADAKGDIKLALSNMKSAQDWRCSFFRDGPVTDTSVAEDLRCGVVYLAGRDRELRPVMIVRPGRVPRERATTEEGLQSLVRILVFCIEYYSRFMLLPGRVENICMILDMQDLSLAQVPLSALRKLHDVLFQQQACRVARFYVCNMSVLFKAVGTFVQSLLTERQRGKIKFVTAQELQQEFAFHQLEEDLGGSRPLLREFLPFPLPPGPFDGGSHAGPSTIAKPGLHSKLSAAGALGRSWDPALSDEENRREAWRTPTLSEHRDEKASGCAPS